MENEHRLARDGTAKSVSRDQILGCERAQGNIHFPCSADLEKDWQPSPVDLYFAIIYVTTILYLRSINKYSRVAYVVDNVVVYYSTINSSGDLADHYQY